MNPTNIRCLPCRSRFFMSLAGALALCVAWACSPAQAAQPKAPAAQDADELPQGELACGNLEKGSDGPYDYRDGSSYIQRMLYLVNLNHYNSIVQSLKGGQTNAYALGDLDFILRHFPNHYPALQTTAQYFLQGGQQMRFRPMECYFDRAIRFVPDDLQVRLLYAIYLRKKGRVQDAVDQMERAFEIAPEPSMELHYNMALIYVEAKNFEKANYHASVAYAMGYPLPGLRDKLQRLGEWRPVPVKIDENTGLPVNADAKTGQPETVASGAKANQ